MGALSEIRQLCQVLSFYSDRLGLMRDPERSAQPSAYGANYLSDGPDQEPYREIAPWYKVVEPLYAELDGLMQSADRSLHSLVFADRGILAVEPKLHRIRACYEFDKEIDEAQALLTGGDVGTKLTHMIEHQSFWTLPPAVIEALAGCKIVAVLGSGPLPLTALTIASALDSHVTCIEREPAAFEIGSRLIELSNCSKNIRSVAANVEELGDLGDYDAIAATVLLGVSLQDHHGEPKAALVEHILQRMRPGAPLILRDPFGLGRLFYPAANLVPADAIDLTRIDPESGPGLTYRSSFIIFRRSCSEQHHAGPSAIRLHT